MKKLIFLFLLIPSLLLAQKHDYVWKLGNSWKDNPLDSNWGTFTTDFSNLSYLVMSYDGDGKMDFQKTCANISDASGNYLFSYNGEYIEDAQNDTMPNSMGLSDSGQSGGDVLPQGGIILPLPNSESKYVLVHMSKKFFESGVDGHKVRYSIIDMNENGGFGSVTEKRHLIIQDTLEFGQLTATKHANGQDWWVLVSKPKAKLFFRLLVTPEGVEEVGEQTIGTIMNDGGVGLACFSPDGTKYVKFQGISNEVGSVLSIFDFDRCTGLLSDPVIMELEHPWGAVAISPNSKILYDLAWDYIFQYDLEAQDIAGSKLQVAKADGYMDTVYFENETLYFPHRFWLGQLAPNGKIYVHAGGNNKLIHIIHNPNRWGQACIVEQHVHIPTLNHTIPNFPNYRLGPIDGSSCDTLGINNLPLARFRYDQNTLDSMSFHFVDLSNYEPTDWAWDFGDGTTSQDTSPVHVFAQAGVYPVCLTVSNEYGTSTMCDTLYLGVVATQEAEIQVAVRVWPNPFRDYLVLSLYDYYPEDAYIYFYDVAGHFLRKQRIRYGENEIDVSGFSRGMLFYEILDGGVWLGFGKIGAE